MSPLHVASVMEDMDPESFKKDVLFLTAESAEVVSDFAHIAAAMAVSGEPPSSKFQAPARRLKVTAEAVEKAVKALCDVMVLAAQAGFSEENVIKLAVSFGFDEASSTAIAAQFQERVSEIRHRVTGSLFGVPNFSRLQWRLDLQLASRNVRRQAIPSFLLKMSTKPSHVTGPPHSLNTAEGREVDCLLISDYETLKRVCNELDQALVEARSGRVRRVMQYIK